MKPSFFIFMFLMLLTAPLVIVAGTEGSGDYRISFTIDDKKVAFPYYANFKIGSYRTAVNHAAIIIHGINRNGNDYYDALLGAAYKAHSLNTNHFMMAPQYLTEDDMDKYNLESEVVFYKRLGWPQGDMSVRTSTYNTPARMSSFAVIDSIVMRLVNTYSKLDTIVLVGHSAGGQFVQRYAAGNRVDSLITADYGIVIRYLPANPSSYMYLNDERRVGNSEDTFESISTFCDYNDYKYGLENLNGYMAEVGSRRIIRQYKERRVYYLLGEEDNDPNHPYLDTRCQAMYQGYHRLQRGRVYYNYLGYYYGPEVYDYQYKVLIPDMGHDYEGMIESDCALALIFNYGQCESLTSLNEQASAETVQSMVLRENYPNPFNPQTFIPFYLPVRERVTLKIYDIHGRVLRHLLKGRPLNSGHHTFFWDGRDDGGRKLSSGIYYYDLQAAGERRINSMILLK